MRAGIRVALVALSMAAAAGCSVHSGPAGSPAASVAPSPSATERRDPLGTAQTVSALGVTMKATTSTYSVVTLKASNEESLPAGTRVAVVEVRGCVTADTSAHRVALTWQPWRLVTSTGATVQASTVYGTGDWSGPLYPNDPNTATPTGRCRNGLIPFPLTGISGTPVAVQYTFAGIVLDWAV